MNTLARSFALGILCASALAAHTPPPPPERQPLTVGTARGLAGQTVRGSLKVAEAADGSAVALPIAIVTGARPGPVVWVEASAHGDEYGGPRALQDVVRSLDPATMTGTVVAVMITNPPAFRALQRVNPTLDDLADMGDAFPGRERFATERIAAVVTAEVRRVAEYFIDLHTGGDRFRQCPFVFYALTGGVPEGRYDELARGFGVPLLWRDTEKIFAHDATTNFSAAGIPSFLLEVGGGQPLDPADLRLQADAVRSFLRKVGVVPGEPARPSSFRIVTGYRIVTNGRGGFFDAAVKPCDRVREGSALGTITDAYGDVIETLRAPAGTDIVLGVSTYPAAPTGGWVLELGTGLQEAVAAAAPIPERPVATSSLAPALAPAPVPEAARPAPDAVNFPGSAEANAPGGRFAVAAADGAGGGQHQLILKDLRSGQSRSLMGFGRSAAVLWAPGGDAVAVTDRRASDSSALVVFFPERPGDPLDLGAELSRRLGPLPEREQNDHVYLEAVRWIDPKTLRFRMRGYGKRDPQGFDELFDYVVDGPIRRPTGLPAR